MNDPAHILVVEDEPKIAALLRDYLVAAGYRVSVLDSGTGAADWIREQAPDAVLLDVMLPGEDGLSICRRLTSREDARPAVIMLSAAGEDTDRIVGLELGADDYLPKPFNPRELVARINAVLRRNEPPATPGAPSVHSDRVGFGPFALEMSTRTLTRDGAPVPITTGEFSLLKVLAQNPRHPMSRDKLMELARGRVLDSSDRSIDVQVSRLRRLLGEDPSSPRFIQTVWGFGYVFVPDGASAK